MKLTTFTTISMLLAIIFDKTITEPVLLGATKTNYICRWYTTSDPPHKRYFVNTIIGCYNKFWSMLQQYPNFLSKFKR